MKFDRAPLGDVCEITMGQAPSGNTYNTKGDGLPLIAGAGDFGTLSPEATKFTNAPTKVSRKGDIILCIRATIGDRNWSDAEYCLGRGVAGLSGRAKRLDQAYLWHWLGHAAPELKSKGRGATFLQVSKSDIASLEIPLPPLAEQRRIAAILDKADALRVKRREAIAKLDQLLQSVFLNMFGDPKTNSKGWETLPLVEICNPKQWPTISARDLEPSGYPVYGANGVIGFYSSFNHEHATVLITCRGATCGTVNVCVPRSYVTGNAMALDNPDTSKVSANFLAAYFRLRGLDDAITGAAQPQITRQNLVPIRVPVPPLELVRRFDEASTSVAKIRVPIASSLKRLESLHGELARRAFAGGIS